MSHDHTQTKTMNTPNTHHTEQGHAAALQTLFPGGLAAMDAAGVRASLDEFLVRRATYTGPMEAPTARGGLTPGRAFDGVSYRLLAGGVARIDWSGPMALRPHFLARLFLGTVDTEELTAAVNSAAGDASARSILLVVDSGGGSVFGVTELADAISQAANVKPVVVVTDGVLGSAAYWVASGASSIYGSGPVVYVGSIGVVSVHTYAPRIDGAVVTEITAGKFKRVGSGFKPLSGDDKAHLQEKVDYLASVFIDAVAKGRKLAPSAVAAQEARIYIGQQAVDAGLLDGFATASSLERQLAADPSRFMRRKAGGGRAPTPAKAPSAAPAKAVSTAPAAAWPPQPQPVAVAVSAESMLEQTGQAEEDLRAEAAELVRMHRVRTNRWPMVRKWSDWERAGKARAAKDGCTVAEGIRREGFVHPYASLPDATKHGTPGAQPVLRLTKEQMAQRAATWSQFKGISVVDAFKYLGFKF